MESFDGCFDNEARSPFLDAPSIGDQVAVVYQRMRDYNTEWRRSSIGCSALQRQDRAVKESEGKEVCNVKTITVNLERYERLHGWDTERGWPTPERLRALDLADVHAPMVEGAAEARERHPILH